MEESSLFGFFSMEGPNVSLGSDEHCFQLIYQASIIEVFVTFFTKRKKSDSTCPHDCDLYSFVKRSHVTIAHQMWCLCIGL